MNRTRNELPLAEPVYSTFHYQGASAVIYENPSIRNWFLNEVFILKCSHRFLNGFTSPDIDIHLSSWCDNPHLEKIWLTMQFARGYINNMIRQMIDEGYYVFFMGVDDYYIEGKTWYKQRHFRHDGLIYGYDQENKTYAMHAYDTNWVYSKFYTPQAAFDRGRRAAFKEAPGSVCAIKPLSTVIDFSPETVIEKLVEYLDSSLEKHPITQENNVYGVVVHDYMAMYLDKLIDDSIPYERMDYRVFRMIWEHKKVMLERLIKTEETLKLGRDTSDAYRKIVDEANSMRMLYASHHMKRRDSLLPIIRKKLMAVKKEEVKMLTGFVKKAKGGLV